MKAILYWEYARICLPFSTWENTVPYFTRKHLSPWLGVKGTVGKETSKRQSFMGRESISNFWKVD